MIEKWRRSASELLGNYKIFNVRADQKVSPKTDKEHTFYVIESVDWINIIPVLPDGKILMIRQYRHGNDEVTLEIPGGMVDPGEAPIKSAVREMREETGFAADSVEQIGFVAPNPALFDNRCYTFLAQDAYQVGAQQFDGTEDIEMERHSLEEVRSMIVSGEITHALTITAFYFYDRYLANQSN